VARRGLAVWAAALTAAVLAAPTAYAASGSPPVTHPDSATIRAGEEEEVLLDPVDNDSDPDGDSLQVCRLDPDLPRKLGQSFVSEGDVVLVANPRARGTFVLTYYACDSSYLTPGTITVTVRPPPPAIDVIQIGDAPPGLLKIKNTYKNRTFQCEWGPLTKTGGLGEVEGTVTVQPRSSEVIKVKEADVMIECYGGNAGYGFAIFSDPDGLRHVVPIT